jgi:hypothetical protein
LIYHSYIRTPAATQDRFRIGVDDTIIVPLVLIAFLARTLYQVAFFHCIPGIGFCFRPPSSGNDIAIARCRYSRRRHSVADQAVRRPAVGVHGEAPSVARPCRSTLVLLTATAEPQGVALTTQCVLQRGISWAFQRCAALSPRAALLVVACVILWLPLSAALSIAMHAVLLANAALLPAWMQLLHPVATIIAKSKLRRVGED